MQFRKVNLRFLRLSNYDGQGVNAPRHGTDQKKVEISAGLEVAEVYMYV